MSLLDDFIAYLHSEVENHSIYVWGGQGKRGGEVTKEWIEKRESDPRNAQRAIKYWKKQCESGYGDRLGAFDCSGLGMYFLQNVKGVYACDLNANSMKGKCRQITRNELKRGDWVFMLSGARATHIGYVVDDLYVIEARGRDHGVCISHVDSRPWQFFGRPEIFKEEIETVMLKKGDKGNAVRALQYALMANGYSLPKYGADGSFGRETLDALTAFKKDHSLPAEEFADSRDASALGFKAGFELTDAASILLNHLINARRDSEEQAIIIQEINKLSSIAGTTNTL